jgi:nicotinamidase/pyrazinamidase
MTRESKALIVIDLQNDFCPGGALAVKEGDRVVPLINRLMASNDFANVLLTQDWHPADHGSFASSHEGRKPGDVVILNGIEQILWPDHCVQETKGAAFHPGLHVGKAARVFRKGTDVNIDSYSAFFDNARKKSTGLDAYLKERGVLSVYLCGLATDYCVKFSALDAVELGFETYVIEDACRGVNLREGDAARAIEEMRERGAQIASFRFDD